MFQNVSNRTKTLLEFVRSNGVNVCDKFIAILPLKLEAIQQRRRIKPSKVFGNCMRNISSDRLFGTFLYPVSPNHRSSAWPPASSLAPCAILDVVYRVVEVEPSPGRPSTITAAAPPPPTPNPIYTRR